MNDKTYIINELKQNVEDFWKWALKYYSKNQILNGEIDSPSFPKWNQIEENLEAAFKKLDFDTLDHDTLENIIFIIAQQWDIGIILNWFNKGGEEIGQIGMSDKQLQILCEQGLNSKLTDAKSQFAASLYKIENKDLAVNLLLKYHRDTNEYVRRQSLYSLYRLNYHNLNEVLLISWTFDEEYERMSCLNIWKKIDKINFDKFSNIAIQDERKQLRDYVLELIQEKD